MKEPLAGGREDIYKLDRFVYRPSNPWTPYVHNFLHYLHEQGMNNVPFPKGISPNDEEVISFVSGTIYSGLLPNNVKSMEALSSVAKLIKQYHLLGADYIKQLQGNEIWMLPPREPQEVMCHGDLAPYNITLDGHMAVGIIDFDTLHPGPKLWDLGYVFYRWLPLMHPDNPENFGSDQDKLHRLKYFLQVYGLDISIKEAISRAIKRLEFLVTYMITEAANGNKTFSQHIQDGHTDLYNKDIFYMKELITKLQIGQKK